MTALKWITTEAKRLKKAYPTRFAKWTEYVAQASATYAKKHGGKSPVGKKKKTVGDYKINKGEFVEAKKPTKPRKKKAAKKKVWSVSRTSAGRFKKKGIKRISGTGTHKDTKSHNVNIRVVSGVNDIANKALQKIKQNNDSIASLKQSIARNKETVKTKVAANTPFWKTWYTKHNKAMSDYIKTLQKENTQLKKHIK
jgi:hypothetical protein